MKEEEEEEEEEEEGERREIGGIYTLALHSPPSLYVWEGAMPCGKVEWVGMAHRHCPIGYLQGHKEGTRECTQKEVVKKGRRFSLAHIPSYFEDDMLTWS